MLALMQQIHRTGTQACLLCKNGNFKILSSAWLHIKALRQTHGFHLLFHWRRHGDLKEAAKTTPDALTLASSLDW